MDLHCQNSLLRLSIQLSFTFRSLFLTVICSLNPFICEILQATSEKISTQLLTSFEPKFSKYLVGKTTMHWRIVKIPSPLSPPPLQPYIISRNFASNYASRFSACAKPQSLVITYILIRNLLEKSVCNLQTLFTLDKHCL